MKPLLAATASHFSSCLAAFTVKVRLEDSRLWNASLALSRLPLLSYSVCTQPTLLTAHCMMLIAVSKPFHYRLVLVVVSRDRTLQK